VGLFKGDGAVDLQLSGKRAVVTGSSSGIGEAIAKALAAEGAAVVVHGRRESEANRVAGAIRAAGGTAVVALGDLGTDAGADAVARAAHDAFDGADILVNNAGAFPQRPWLESTADEWNDLYNQNVGSMVRLITRLVPGMKRRGWGRVISIASGVATTPFAEMGNYSATKGANINLAVSLAKALAGTGITSNAVSPGMVMTPGVEEMLKGMAPQLGLPADDLAALEQFAVKNMVPNPSARLGRVEDIAATVAFLASPLAGYINGANIRVDGGTVGTVN
jgi:NAD(P)-dependent dehydrogenase (short-subunit alcohol dehydrogenase family)